MLPYKNIALKKRQEPFFVIGKPIRLYSCEKKIKLYIIILEESLYLFVLGCLIFVCRCLI